MRTAHRIPYRLGEQPYKLAFVYTFGMRIPLSINNGILRILLFSVLILLQTALVTACIQQPASRDLQDRYYTSVDDIYLAADRIVTGLLMEETAEEVDGQMLIYRTYVVTESVKGSAREKDEIHVAMPADLSIATVIGGEPFVFRVGDEHALFLKGRARNTSYPSEYGGTVWTLNGEPSLSQASEDGMLEFAVSSLYKEVTGINEHLFSASWLDFVNISR